MADHLPLNPAMPEPAAVQNPNLPFHLLGRLPGRTWWRPLVVLGAAAGAVIVGLLVWFLGWSPVLLTRGEELFDDMTDPLSLAFNLGALALLIPVALVAVRVAGRRAPGTVLSVEGRMRWRVLGRAFLVAGAVMVPAFTLTFLIDPGSPQERTPGQIVALCVIALALTPLQSAGEELVFRGLLPQILGGWLRSPWIAYGLPLVAFTLGHEYDASGQAGVLVFGLVAAWLTWRSGGLELAIALHATNNTLLFLMAAVGLIDPNVTTGTWLGFAVDAAVTLITGWALMRFALPQEPTLPAASRT